jgi:hypothetical protein
MFVSRNLARSHHPLRDDFAGHLDLRAQESIFDEHAPA